MPIYEYKCLKNNHHFDVLLTGNDTPPTRCKHCDSDVTKVMSSAAFHLKGAGWYSTDYKKKSGGNTEKSSASETPTPSSGGCGTGCGCHPGPTKSGDKKS